MGLVVNRVKEEKETVRLSAQAQEMSLEVFGFIPEDENITNYDFVGKPIINIPETSPSVAAVLQILRKLNLI